MNRQLGISLSILALAIPSIAIAQVKPQLTEEGVICSLAGTCGDSQSAAPAADQSTAVGEERAFSLFRGKPATAAAAPSTARPGPKLVTTNRPAAQQPGARSGPKLITAKKASAAGAATPARSADMLVTFRSGSADMTPQAVENARLVARALQSPQLGSGQFLVEGHTDAVGNRAYNLDLSKRRAEAVVQFLVKQGVPASRLRAEGFGFDRLRNPARPTDGSNRRVQVVKVG